jgi:DNA-binding CsgD family transcriptional regulator
MAAQVEPRALASGCGGPGARSGCAADRERLGAALVAALELATLAAHRLLAECDTAAGRHAEAATHLERALALADSSVSPHERARVLLGLAGGNAAAGWPEAAQAASVPAPAETRRSGGTTSARTAPACPNGLSAREVEVLRLLAGGGSNRQIAAALYLSLRTVERHIANVYAKTGAHGRAAATAYALRRHLA